MRIRRNLSLLALTAAGVVAAVAGPVSSAFAAAPATFNNDGIHAPATFNNDGIHSPATFNNDGIHSPASLASIPGGAATSAAPE